MKGNWFEFEPYKSSNGEMYLVLYIGNINIFSGKQIDTYYCRYIFAEVRAVL